MEIKRDHYLNKLILKKHNRLVKVITGIRRCGKSYLLFTLFKNHLLNEGVDPSHIIEMAFDSIETRKYRDPERCFDYLKNQVEDNDMYYILLDEVQLLDSFEDVLNGLLRLNNVDIYVTGSNAKFLSKDIITEFRGRGDELHINPLTFSEFMSVYNGSTPEGWRDYVLYGGLPPVVLLPTEEQKIDLLNALFQETYINDITSRHKIRHKEEFEELINILSSGIGSLTNVKKLENTFKSKKQVTISSNTLKSYLEYLEDAFIIESASRYDLKGRKYINAMQKYYFTDIGLRNARIKFRQIEETHTMENIIYNELRARGLQVDIGVYPVQERNKNGDRIRKEYEVDFVCNIGSKRYYLQSAYAMPDPEKIEQEQRSLLKIDDSFKKMIILKDTLRPWYTDKGILVIGLYDFLLNPDSLNL